MGGVGLGEQEPPDAHRGVLDVAGFQHAVEVLLDGLEIQSLGGLVWLVQHHKAEHVVFDAVPLGGVVGMGALEESFHGQQAAGVTCEVVQAHAGSKISP